MIDLTHGDIRPVEFGHSGPDQACPVRDTGKSMFSWISAGVYPVLDTGRE